MTSLYTKADGSISKYVLFSGDPWRVKAVAGYMDNVEHVAFAREFNTYTGDYRGVRITATSTGIGAPSAAIAMEEMYENGMQVAVRMGTTMGLQAGSLGRFVIPVAALREESTSATYVAPSYPAVADLDLLGCMNRAVVDLGGTYCNGLTCSMDGFYSQMKESRFAKECGRQVQATFARLKSVHVCSIDMESSCILTLARLMGISGCVITITTVLEGLADQLPGKDRADAEDLLCRAALEGVVNFAQLRESSLSKER